jgi:hypothetical protein
MYNNMTRKIHIHIIGFEVFTSVVMKIYVFWDIIHVARESQLTFRRNMSFHLQGGRISQARNQREMR